MSEPHPVHNISGPPKGPAGCHEDAADDDKHAEPCGRFRSRLDGSPEAYRLLWQDFFERHPPNFTELDPDFAADSAMLVEEFLPPTARRLLAGQLQLPTEALTDGSRGIARIALRSMDAEVVAVDAAGRLRTAVAQLITPDDITALTEVMAVLEVWDSKRRSKRQGARKPA